MPSGPGKGWNDEVLARTVSWQSVDRKVPNSGGGVAHVGGDAGHAASQDT